MRAFDRKKARARRHASIRKHVSGTTERPRLVINRSLTNIQAQIIDDTKGVTLLGMSSLSKEIETKGKKKIEVSKAVGKLLAEKAKEKGIEKIVFDRNGFLYHGRVKAFADGARDGGLQF
jgi:large subunit ribosomal protein L18